MALRVEGLDRRSSKCVVDVYNEEPFGEPRHGFEWDVVLGVLRKDDPDEACALRSLTDDEVHVTKFKGIDSPWDLDRVR